MSERRYRGVTIAQASAGMNTPEYREAMRKAGVTAAEAVENCRAWLAALDRAAWKAPTATVRPEVWKRLNREPSRWDRLRAWGRA